MPKKLAYLKSYVKGEPKQSIAGYNSGIFYEDAVETLKEQFGKNSSIVRSFKKRLSELKSPDNSYQSLRSFVNDTKCVCRQLKSLGFDPEGNDSVEDLVY